MAAAHTMLPMPAIQRLYGMYSSGLNRRKSSVSLGTGFCGFGVFSTMRVALARGEVSKLVVVQIDSPVKMAETKSHRGGAMDALPRDVLVSILSSLPIEDVISVSQVSRWMFEASQDDRVWARREQWRSLPNLVAERAVGKWLGTVLGLPWQVIALNIKFDPRNDRKSETGSPTSALRHLVPCRAELYLGMGTERRRRSIGSGHGQELTRVNLLHLRVLRGGVHENVLKDWKKDANAASSAIHDGLYNVMGEAGVPPVSDDLLSRILQSPGHFSHEDYHDREEGYKGFGLDNVFVAGESDDDLRAPMFLMFELKPRVLVAAALMTRMDASMFEDASDGANSSPPPWSRKIEETRKENSGWTCWASQVLRPPNPKTEWSLLRARVVGVSLKAMHEAPMPPFDALSFDQIPWGPAVRLVTQTVQNGPHPSDNVDAPQTASAWPSLVLGPLPEADAERKRRRVTASGEAADGDESEKSRMQGFTVGGCKYKPDRSEPRLSVRGVFKMTLHNYRRLFRYFNSIDDERPAVVDAGGYFLPLMRLENLVSRGLISETQDFSSEAAATVCLEMANRGPRYQDTSIGEYMSGGIYNPSRYHVMFIFYELMERCNRSRPEGVDEAAEIVNKLQQDDEYIPIELWDQHHAFTLADFPKHLQEARKQCDPFDVAMGIAELAFSWRTWQWRLEKSTPAPPSELADRIREILDRRTYEAMRLALTLLGILE